MRAFRHSVCCLSVNNPAYFAARYRHSADLREGAGISLEARPRRRRRASEDEMRLINFWTTGTSMDG